MGRILLVQGVNDIQLFVNLQVQHSSLILAYFARPVNKWYVGLLFLFT